MARDSCAYTTEPETSRAEFDDMVTRLSEKQIIHSPRQRLVHSHRGEEKSSRHRRAQLDITLKR